MVTARASKRSGKRESTLISPVDTLPSVSWAIEIEVDRRAQSNVDGFELQSASWRTDHRQRTVSARSAVAGTVGGHGASVDGRLQTLGGRVLEMVV